MSAVHSLINRKRNGEDGDDEETGATRPKAGSVHRLRVSITYLKKPNFMYRRQCRQPSSLGKSKGQRVRTMQYHVKAAPL